MKSFRIVPFIPLTPFFIIKVFNPFSYLDTNRIEFYSDHMELGWGEVVGKFKLNEIDSYEKLSKFTIEINIQEKALKREKAFHIFYFKYRFLPKNINSFYVSHFNLNPIIEEFKKTGIKEIRTK